MKILTNRENGSLLISLEGMLRLEEAGMLKEALLGALNEVDHIVIDLSEVKDAHFSYLQMLCAAHKSCIGRGTTLSIEGVGKEIRQVIRKTGYAHEKGCMPGSPKCCIWM